jgi:hypothetical protein
VFVRDYATDFVILLVSYLIATYLRRSCHSENGSEPTMSGIAPSSTWRLGSGLRLHTF